MLEEREILSISAYPEWAPVVFGLAVVALMAFCTLSTGGLIYKDIKKKKMLGFGDVSGVQT